MKNKLLLIIIAPMLLLYSCGMGQSGDKVLTPQEFKQQLSETEGGVLLDVRTPGEFAQGHLENAVNIDWNEADFDARVKKMDQSSPVFVYCLSGGRSAAAAEHMRSLGFSNVFEMEGGILAWRSANLPETTGSVAKKAGMTDAEFSEMINSDKTVLIDFYAEWCGPCKKMEPSLQSLSKELEATVKIVRIDVDQNPELARKLGITALPTLHIYKQGTLTWQHVGYLEKADISEAVKK